MVNLFDRIPTGFFNCLASGGNNRIYADCLQVIYEQYDREISYRISRSRIRDALAAYLLENHIDFLEQEPEQNASKNYNDMANGIIRKFCSKEIIDLAASADIEDVLSYDIEGICDYLQINVPK